MQAYDAALAPTVTCVPPRFDELEDFDAYVRTNATIRRNAACVNLLDGCALTLPCHESGELPVGTMLIGPAGHDASILALGSFIEPLLRS